MDNKPFNFVNIALIVAVGTLFYLHFYPCKGAACAGDACDSTAVMPATMPLSAEKISSGKTVFVNSDILNSKYEFVTDLAAQTIKKQQRLELAYQNKGQKLQQDFAEFQQKASQGLLSENQGVAIQQDLRNRKEELDNMEGELQKLMEEIQKRNEEVRKTVVDYIKEYTANANYDFVLTYTEGPGGIILLANDSLDITNEVLEGLNAQYRATKVKKK